jgi:predicted rRNA methylase
MKFSLTNNPDATEIELFADLKVPRVAATFVAEGEKVVVRLLESKLEIISLYLTEDHFTSKREQIESHIQSSEAKIIISSKSEMEKIVGFPLHQGILASAKIPKERPIGEIIRESAKPLLYVMLDEIVDAENMGAIYRTALAMGVTAVIVDPKSISPWIRRAVRVSIGAVFSLPMVTVPSLHTAIDDLRRQGITVYATTLNPMAPTLSDSDLSGDLAFIFGSEGRGVKPGIVSAAGKELTIPMPHGVDSLNVAVAQGIFLYEAYRQRRLL